MAGLLVAQDLQEFLHREVTPAAAAIAIRVAGGWLSDATGITAWPEPVPEDLFAWAVELAALAWSNPEGLSTLAVGDVSRAWALARREEILASARLRFRGTSGGPLHSFPPVQPFPPSWGDRTRYASS